MTKLKKEDEIVVVVHNNDVFNHGLLRFQGAMQDKKTVDTIMNNIDLNYTVMRRGSTSEVSTPVYKNAELNFDFKQPIPYVIIKQGDKLYAYERLNKGGEQRLHSKLSIGWGGHQNALKDSLSVSIEEVILENLNRELEEELNIVTDSQHLNFIGLINDDENEVGRVHLGVLALLELPMSATVTVRETDQLRGFWTTMKDWSVPANFDRLESWSQIAVNVLKGEN